MIRFAVIAAPRVGTHMLRSGLNKHPDIFVGPEVLQPNRYLPKNKQITGGRLVAKWLAQSKRERKEACIGTLLHRNMFWVKSHSDVWLVVKKWHTKFISLVRDNILRKFLSQEIAIQLNNWDSHRKREKRPKPVTLSVARLKEHVETCQRYFELGDMCYPGRLSITYEELCEDWHGTLRRVQEYLGVPVRKLRLVTVKQEHRSLQESIANYEEVATAVRDWGYARWL